MLNPDFEVTDRTTGDADKVQGTVIIHDVVSNNPSMISYDWEIAEALEELSGPLPDDYEHLPEECQDAWTRGTDFGEMDGLEAALGVSIEHFEDFLAEHSGEWDYPDDVDKTDRQKTDRQTGEEDMTIPMIDNSDFAEIFEQVKARFEKWGEELKEGGWNGKVSLLIEGEPDSDSSWIAPHVGAGFSLKRSVGDNKPIQYDPELEYLEGTDDENYPVNLIHEELMEYTGTSTYWYNLILRIHEKDGVSLSVIG